MTFKAITIGAALLCAVPLAAQQRGTVEFGAFGTLGHFDNSLSLKEGHGVGGRVGVFLDPRWMVEFEAGEMRATRPSGLLDVNVGILSARLTNVPLRAGPLSLLLGLGAGVGTETNFLHSYGVNALVGAKIALGHSASFRLDGQQDWLANYNYKAYRRVTAGLSLSRELFVRNHTEIVRVMVPGPAAAPLPQRPDSVSAEEQGRRRGFEQRYRDLRDSLNNHPPVLCPTPAPDLSSMEDRILFKFDKSDITDAARVILDAKVVMFQANPSMTVLIVGNADTMGSDPYNMALGTRRAESAKAYLVSRGIDASRIETDSKGEREPVAFPNPVTKVGNAPNRRDMFRLVVVPDVIKP